jgi:hypothetical protein
MTLDDLKFWDKVHKISHVKFDLHCPHQPLYQKSKSPCQLHYRPIMSYNNGYGGMPQGMQGGGNFGGGGGYNNGGGMRSFNGGSPGNRGGGRGRGRRGMSTATT